MIPEICEIIKAITFIIPEAINKILKFLYGIHRNSTKFLEIVKVEWVILPDILIPLSENAHLRRS